MLSQPVMASQDRDIQTTAPRQPNPYVLQSDNLTFEVDPSHGARIIAFRLDDENILTPPSVDPQNYGSTFWPSPQNIWEWPPIAEIDTDPYTVETNSSAVLMKSEISAELELQITKRFVLDVQRSRVAVEYTITNFSETSQTFSPWEVSRVHPDGLTFYPTGDATLGSGPFEPLTTQELNGITWFKYDSQTIQANQKLYADGAEGWLAHLDGDKLLIKSFQDIPLDHQAPTEGEIEIFANAERPYIEIEQQGAYTKISPQESLSWTVYWYLRRLPINIAAKVGSEKLVEFVRDVVAS